MVVLQTRVVLRCVGDFAMYISGKLASHHNLICILYTCLHHVSAWGRRRGLR